MQRTAAVNNIYQAILSTRVVTIEAEKLRESLLKDAEPLSHYFLSPDGLVCGHSLVRGEALVSMEFLCTRGLDEAKGIERGTNITVSLFSPAVV